MDTPTVKVFDVRLEDPAYEEALRTAIGQRSASGLPRPSCFQEGWRYSLASDHRSTFVRYILYVKHGNRKGDKNVRIGAFSIGTPPPGRESADWNQTDTIPKAQRKKRRAKADLTINPQSKGSPKRKVAILFDSTGMPYPVDASAPDGHGVSELNLGKRAALGK